MLNSATIALLSFLDEVCESVSARETGARTHVAQKILQPATRGEVSPEGLRQVGHNALSQAPTIWRWPIEDAGVNFQVTVLKILVSYPGGFAVMDDIKRDMAILATSGRDWADRTKRLAVRVPDLDIFSQGLVDRESGGWKITNKGRAVLEFMEARTGLEQPVEAVSAEMPVPPLPPLAERAKRRRERRQRRREGRERARVNAS
jgi:hypothetical protein